MLETERYFPTHHSQNFLMVHILQNNKLDEILQGLRESSEKHSVYSHAPRLIAQCQCFLAYSENFFPELKYSSAAFIDQVYSLCTLLAKSVCNTRSIFFTIPWQFYCTFFFHENFCVPQEYHVTQIWIEALSLLFQIIVKFNSNINVKF